MSAGLQEIVALGIVALVVIAVIYRRWKRAKNAGPGGCSSCAENCSAKGSETSVRFHTREP